ncbi:MAG: Gfo/Idh/MocA family oxidoreductase [Armatimonadota bacterium]|nr:Gfo/Idh/MocA family oxidoreductase [Armatimonadota bacterium]
MGGLVHDVLVVGGGSIGERHIRCFLATGRARVATCEARSDRLAELARNYPLTAAYPAWEEVPLERFGVVVVCTPAPLHEAMFLRALDAGAHVLCEKPLALDPSAAQRMADAAARASRVTGTAYVYRSMATLAHLKARLEHGEVGRVRHVLGVMGQDFPRYRPAYADVYYRSHETGGGALQDALTHVVNYVQWCVGLETHVCCQADHLVLPRVDVEDTVALTLRRPGEWLASLTLNQFQKNNDIQLDFAGETGTLRYDFRRAQLGLCRGEEWLWSEPYRAQRDDYFQAQAGRFLDAVEGKGPFPCSVAEGAETVRTIAAALVSWREGRVVRVRKGGEGRWVRGGAKEGA